MPATRGGDHFTRVPPLVLRPESFADAWLNLPWNEALRSIRSGQIAPLHSWHYRFQHERKSYLPNLTLVQPCPGTGHRWQVGLHLKLQGQAPASPLPRTLFLTVSHLAGQYWMDDITDLRPPGCPGSTPPNTIPDDAP